MIYLSQKIERMKQRHAQRQHREDERERQHKLAREDALASRRRAKAEQNLRYAAALEACEAGGTRPTGKRTRNAIFDKVAMGNGQASAVQVAVARRSSNLRPSTSRPAMLGGATFHR